MPDPNNLALFEHDTVFMLLPKVANTSIKIAIAEAVGKELPHDAIHTTKTFEYISKEQAKTFTHRIAFVRDPLTRLASCYRDKFLQHTDRKFLAGFKDYGLQDGVPFLKFIERIAVIPDEKARGVAQHFRGMAYDLCEGDEIIPNWIGRFETLDKDWAELRAYLLEHTGLRLPALTHEKQTQPDRRAEYCPRGRAFTLQRYREDVRLFGYRRPYKFDIDPDGITVGRSICNVIRETYQIARDHVDDEATSRRLQELLAEAFDMGKRMNARLGRSQYE